MSNQLEFIDTADMSTMNSVDHAGVTDVEWDPTGRYVTSAVSFWSQKVGWWTSGRERGERGERGEE